MSSSLPLHQPRAGAWLGKTEAEVVGPQGARGGRREGLGRHRAPSARGVGGPAGAAGTRAHRPRGQPGLALRPPRAGHQRRGKWSASTTVFFDITQRALAEQALRRASRSCAAAKEAAEDASRAKSRVPGQHEPRDPHADERRARPDRAAARDPARRAAAAVRRDRAAARARRCCRSSTTSSTSPRSRPASSSSRRSTSTSTRRSRTSSQLLAPRAHAKELELACRIDERLPAAVRGDPTGCARCSSTWSATR